RCFVGVLCCCTLVCTRPNFSPRKRALRLAQGVAVMTWTTKILIGALLLVAAAYGVHVFRYKLTVSLPDYPPIEKTVLLEQNWSVKNRDWFHDANQGTLTFSIPYEWFVALEQPVLSIFAAGLLSDPTYLDRYGFIPNSTETEHDKDNVSPVGFARGQQIRREAGTPWLTAPHH